MDNEGDPEHPAGSKHYNADEPEDWAEVVRLGYVWSMNEKAQRDAIDDLVSGKLPLNDKIPPQIRDFLEAEMAQ
jgi:hypothetical protein